MGFLDYDGLNTFVDGLAEELKKAFAKISHTHTKSDITDFPEIIKATGTFDGLGWTNNGDGFYSQSVEIAGVTAQNIIIANPAPAYLEDYTRMGCFIASQADGSLTFKCTDPEDIDITVNVLIFNI